MLEPVYVLSSEETPLFVICVISHKDARAKGFLENVWPGLRHEGMTTALKQLEMIKKEESLPSCV